MRLPQKSMIGAFSIKRKTFFTVNQDKNNSITFWLFILNLIKELDSLNLACRTTKIILLDNAFINRAKNNKKTLKPSD